ncbi:pyridoxamine 5'-phosphate oxidase-domain-containing protein [Trametes polyzona]|nr:pyridoxamine 5'-phosphate oxidase-domain-containing protein [Trametes polyzona]
MATVYPGDHTTLAGEPFALQEYYASCHANGSLTLLFLPISRHSQNVLQSPAHAASITIASDPPAARRPRVALIGNVTVFPVLEHTPDLAAIQACYIAQHPDARWWLPGPREPHVAYWARFDPHTVYFVGGFGDEHYIGYVPLELYQNALAGDLGVAGRVLVDQHIGAF